MTRRKPDDRRVELNMTPMIDVVFQLLAFFVMTFTVLAQEGDFAIEARRLPPGVPQPSPALDLPDRVILNAGTEGRLIGVVFRGIRYSDVAEFGAVVQREHEAALATIPLFEIVCDERLKYAHVMEVMDVLHPLAKEVKLSVRAE